MGMAHDHGYLYQLARASRFFERVLNRTGPLKGLDPWMVRYEDDLWSFFIHCWHVRDWIREDDSLSLGVRQGILAAANASHPLCVCADIANGRKHARLTRHRAGVELDEMRLTPTTPNVEELVFECFLSWGPGEGESISSLDAAIQALRAWKEILEANGLPLPVGFPNDLTPRGQWFPDGWPPPPPRASP
ncbi:MAG: hypothetical protein Q8R92_15945 [Deltaproteobacteria bacterium]|nr:hypothetical protein [Deltaproteobacteria bacterium]